MRRRVPGTSFSVSQVWLNQTQGTSPVPSETSASTSVSRRPERREPTWRTRPSIVASSPIISSAMERSGAAGS